MERNHKQNNTDGERPCFPCRCIGQLHRPVRYPAAERTGGAQSGETVTDSRAIPETGIRRMGILRTATDSRAIRRMATDSKDIRRTGIRKTAMGSRAIRRMGIPRTATGSRHSARHRAAMRHGRAIPRDSVRRAVRRQGSRLRRGITAVRPTASPSVPRDRVTISHAGKLPGRRRRDRIRPGRARPDGNRQSRVRRDRVPVGTVLHESGRVLF